MTLDEIMRGREPGSVRVRLEMWEKHEWFSPHFCDGDGVWYGVCENGWVDSFVDDNPQWLIIPKTRTVKLYAAILKFEDGSYNTSVSLFETIEAARKALYTSNVIALTDQPLATVEVKE